ncbi:phenylacetate--CoA ligase family protein [Alisedimentitalea sp. MJ-SS2]|uniref:phenylacetate--CoA ligase family protein n=1 Tax=Aliisedimentitalea sp. MJ-SS2 TaxID=3049795 RepID=UPI00290618F3|nr:phenylacetate--CoA ligase family protein [Alisedimentitalea sp. MJ-SS2]MDU8928847.1 phenylacetate--CoA ligase family protein [Alisedimentitalea sp. MJ-SS2]
MQLLPDGDKAPLGAIKTHAQSAWQAQRQHVVANSPFYRTLWDDQTPPERLEDLPTLPLSDKSQLRLSQAAHPPFGDYLATPRATVNRLHRTSGTTGQAMNLALSPRDTQITETVGGRCHASAGLTPDHTVVHCLNYQMWMGGLTDHMTLEATGALVVPFGVGSTDLLIRTIKEVGITAISCTPSYPAVLEQHIAADFPGLSPRDLGLRLGLFGGEPGLDDPAFRARLSETWGMQPRNANYGVSDVFSNFAAECPHDTALHFMASDALWPELINPDTGDVIPLEQGQSGELVLTHLIRDCQPLVRFRTGDIIRLTATDPCQCGCTGFRFRVVGRSDDMVVVRGLNMFPTMVAAVLNEIPELSGDYRIHLSTPPPHDHLPVTAELAPGVDSSPDLASRVAATIKTRLGATAQVTLIVHGTLPRTAGKTKRVLRDY